MYRGGELVGYMRLRHGFFTVDCGEVNVYCVEPEGDGIFADHERDTYLNNGCHAILQYLSNPKEELLFEIVSKKPE